MTDTEYLLATSIMPLGALALGLLIAWLTRGNRHPHPGE